KPAIFTTSYLRWKREERETLFASRLLYTTSLTPFRVFSASLEKLGSMIEVSAFSRLLLSKQTLGMSVVETTDHYVYYTRKFGYFLAFLDFIPRIVNITTNRSQLPTELKELRFSSETSSKIAIA